MTFFIRVVRGYRIKDIEYILSRTKVLFLKEREIIDSQNLHKRGYRRGQNLVIIYVPIYCSCRSVRIGRENRVLNIITFANLTCFLNFCDYFRGRKHRFLRKVSLLQAKQYQSWPSPVLKFFLFKVVDLFRQFSNVRISRDRPLNFYNDTLTPTVLIT